MNDCRRCGAKFEGDRAACPKCRSKLWRYPRLKLHCTRCKRNFFAKGINPPATCPFPDCRSPLWDKKKMNKEERRAAILEGIRLKKMGMVVVKKRAGEEIAPGSLVALNARGRAVRASAGQSRIIGIAQGGGTIEIKKKKGKVKEFTFRPNLPRP